jgi:phosphoglycolate phosphatase-like HAD superfamily hydrolase
MEVPLAQLTARLFNPLLFVLLLCSLLASPAVADPLPSWNEGATKQSLLAFVAGATTPGTRTFVPSEQRIAVFDNDGTLWSEKPIYFQFMFALDRIRQLAPQHPEWQTEQPFKAVLEGDMVAIKASGKKGMVTIIMTALGDATTDQFAQLVSDWIVTAQHPKLKRPYTDLVFQPMLEVLTYFRANGFKTYIVSGGSLEFMRPWAQQVYGIPPEQVVGSRTELKFELVDEKYQLVQQSAIGFMNDKAGKPVAIHQHVGRRPLATFGNSDGDLQMLQWTAAGEGQPYMMLVHHTDAEREWAYDRKSTVGHLDKALDKALDQNWNIADMQKDWKVIYPFQLEGVIPLAKVSGAQ